MAYSTDSAGRFVHHLRRHKEFYFLPPTLILNVENGIVREYHTFDSALHSICFPIYDLQNIINSLDQKAHEAIQKFAILATDMDHYEIDFAPVMVEIEGKIVKSPLSNFYRSVSIFHSFLGLNVDWFGNGQLAAKVYFDRILDFGKSPEAEARPFFPRKSMETHETITTVRKLDYWPMSIDMTSE